MLIIKITALAILFVITGGSVFSDTFKKHKPLLIAAAIFSFVGSFYLIKSIYIDFKTDIQSSIIESLDSVSAGSEQTLASTLVKEQSLNESNSSAPEPSLNTTNDDSNSVLKVEPQKPKKFLQEGTFALSKRVKKQALNNSNSSTPDPKDITQTLPHVIYFDTDMSSIKREFGTPLNNLAAYLNQNPSARVTLNGYTDGSGSREYNVALGFRRAKSVANYLRVAGVSNDAYDIVAFGEEGPFSSTLDNEGLSKRRVVIDYIK